MTDIPFFQFLTRQPKNELERLLIQAAVLADGPGIVKERLQRLGGFLFPYVKEISLSHDTLPFCWFILIFCHPRLRGFPMQWVSRDSSVNEKLSTVTVPQVQQNLLTYTVKVFIHIKI